MSLTDPIEIARITMSLKPENSSGHGGLSSKLLKTLNQSICIPMCTIINKSLHTGDVPRGMKIAKVTPIYKYKDKTDIRNYSPLFLLPSLSRILEKNYFLKGSTVYGSRIHCLRTSVGSDRSTAPLMK